MNILHTKFLLSYQEIYNLHVDFNTNSNKLLAPIEIIEKYQETYPNITNTTLPIKEVKANYFLQNGDYDKALELINKSKNINPFVGFGDYLKAKIFHSKGMKDSAFYYGEKAYLKIPKNVAHAVFYQSLLFDIKNYSRLQEVFQEVKVLKNELIWQNHFSAVISENNKDVNNSFSSNDKTDIKTAIILFPKNILFKSFDLIINQGQNASTLAIKYDITAKKYYAEKKYQDAIEYWEKASKIVVNEDSYILNIAFSYSILENYNTSLEYLKTIEFRNIKSNDGFFEFISGYNLLKLEKLKEACVYFRASNSMGYINAGDFLTQVNCQTKY